MKYTVTPNPTTPDVFRVEGVAEGQEPEVTIFHGPNSEARANHYAEIISATEGEAEGQQGDQNAGKPN